VPAAFWWTGDTIVIATAVKSAKITTIRKHPRVALCVDKPGMPPRSLLVRGAATVDIVDGVPDEYVAGSRKITPAEAMPAWEAGVRALYAQMAVITIQPDHVVLHDFETTIPKAVADLIAAHGDPPLSPRIGPSMDSELLHREPAGWFAVEAACRGRHGRQRIAYWPIGQ
jgi:hypothetical protein